MPTFVHLLPLLLLTLGGCAGSGPKWGEQATWSPGWSRVKQAAANAARDPATWIPLGGAAAITLLDNDRHVSEEAQLHHPVFGSEREASEQTDRLRDLLFYGHIASMLLTPSGETTEEWLGNKARGVLVQEGALWATRVSTNLLKANVDRDAPNTTAEEANTESFPSNHATGPFAAAALIRRNLTAMPAVPKWGRYTLTGGAYLAAAGSAWGRVEMGLHHPADQMVGMALGNFLGLFVHDAFMGEDAPRLGFEPAGDGWQAQLGWRY